MFKLGVAQHEQAHLHGCFIFVISASVAETTYFTFKNSYQNQVQMHIAINWKIFFFFSSHTSLMAYGGGRGLLSWRTKSLTQQETSLRLAWFCLVQNSHTHTLAYKHKWLICWTLLILLQCPGGARFEPWLHILAGSILLYALQPARPGTSRGSRRFMKPSWPGVKPRRLPPRGFLLKTITSSPGLLWDSPWRHWRDLFVLTTAAVCVNAKRVPLLYPEPDIRRLHM